MTTRDKFRYVEKCLYNYHANIARIEVLRFDLAELRRRGDVRGQSYMVNRRTMGNHSDPPAEFEQECSRIESEINRLVRITNPITLMLSHLDNPHAGDMSRKKVLKEVYQVVYEGGNLMEEACVMLGMSRKTCYARRMELVRVAGEYLGIM